MDDIFKEIEALEEHNKVFNKIMSKIKSAGLTLNLDRSSFRKSEINV